MKRFRSCSKNNVRFTAKCFLVMASLFLEAFASAPPPLPQRKGKIAAKRSKQSQPKRMPTPTPPAPPLPTPAPAPVASPIPVPTPIAAPSPLPEPPTPDSTIVSAPPSIAPAQPPTESIAVTTVTQTQEPQSQETQEAPVQNQIVSQIPTTSQVVVSSAPVYTQPISSGSSTGQQLQAAYQAPVSEPTQFAIPVQTTQEQQQTSTTTPPTDGTTIPPIPQQAPPPVQSTIPQIQAPPQLSAPLANQVQVAQPAPQPVAQKVPQAPIAQPIQQSIPASTSVAVVTQTVSTVAKAQQPVTHAPFIVQQPPQLPPPQLPQQTPHVIAPSQQGGPETVDSIEKIGLQGNWLKKREWLIKTHEATQEIQDLVTQAEQARKLFMDAFNDIDNALDAYYEQFGLEQGKINKLFDSINRYLSKKTQKEISAVAGENKEKIDPEIQEKIESIQNSIQPLKQQLEQLSLDMKSIEDLDNSLASRIKRVDEQMNIINDEAQRARDIAQELWDIIDHNKAREKYYEVKLAIYEKVKNIQLYLKDDLFNDFQAVIQTIKAQITKTQDQITKLESDGIFIKDRAQKVKEEKAKNSGGQSAQDQSKPGTPEKKSQDSTLKAKKQAQSWYNESWDWIKSKLYNSSIYVIRIKDVVVNAIKQYVPFLSSKSVEKKANNKNQVQAVAKSQKSTP